MTQTLGSRVGRYTVWGLLGSSGVAVTYRASDEDGSEVVLKVLRNYFLQEPRLVTALFDELDRVKRLDHPGIVTPLETGQEAQGTWVVYPYVPWPTLRGVLASGPLSPGLALAVLRDLAQALDYAHNQGVLHRDVKPENIFVGPEGQARIIDFGMAGLGEESHALMRATLRTPDPAYSAPEQILRRPATPLTDVYSLAAVAYEMLTGALPFPAIGAPSVLAMQMDENPNAASRHNPALPAAVDDVLSKSLAYQPPMRYQSGAELVQAVEEALGDVAQQFDAPAPVASAPVATSLGQATLVPAPAPTAAPAVPSSPSPDAEAATETVIYCPACAQANPPDALYCYHCWARLKGRRLATREEAQRFLKRLSRELLRRRIIAGTVLTAAVVAVGVMTFQAVVDFPVPKPVSDVSAVIAPGSWGMHGRDFNHSAAVEQGGRLAGEVAWRFPTDGPLLSEPAVVDGVVYQTTGDKRILALNERDGEVLWEVQATGPVYASPALTEDTVYVGLLDSRLRALDRMTGELRWEFDSDGPIFAPAIVHNGVVYPVDWSGTIYGVDALDGTELWRAENKELVLEPPIIYEGDVDAIAIVGFGGRSYVVDWTIGEQRLMYDAGQPVMSAPVFAGDYMLLSTRWGGLVAVDWRETKYPYEDTVFYWRTNFWVWGFTANRPIPRGFVWGTGFGSDREVWSPAVVEDTAYVALSDGWLHAVSVENGEKLWAYDSGSPSRVAPVVVGGLVYIGNDEGEVHAVDRHTGEGVQVFSGGEPLQGQLVWGGNTLYAITKEGTLLAFR